MPPRRRNKKNTGPERLGPLVEQVLVSLGQEARLAEARILVLWRDLVGDGVASRSLPLGISGTILTVGVFNAAWQGQLNFLREEMAAKINRRLGPGTVSSIRLVPENRPAWWPPRGKKAPPPVPEPLPEDEARIVEEACSGVSDPGLREIFRRILTRQSAVNRARGEAPTRS
jgi:hypothetical protein